MYMKVRNFGNSIWYKCMLILHCKNGIVNVTTKPSDVHYFRNHYMVVIIKLSDAHYNNSERHYLEPRVQCSDELCSDRH